MNEKGSSPRVSLIIPAYNYADYIGKAIQSALDQTYPDLEVVVVDDGSTDHTAQAVEAYTRQDARVRYVHQPNGGLPSARNTGIRASQGEILAFLDADDWIHPEKIQNQVGFLNENPDVGLTYNTRLLVASNGEPLFYQRAPLTVNLVDLVLGYPFTPSDVVVRREWAYRVGLFDESFVLNSEDLDFHLRLALAGCQFAGVMRAFTFRQVHTGRAFRNLAGKMDTYLRALDTAFNAPDCPPEVLQLRHQAYAFHYRTWGFQALAQGETALGQDFLRQARQLAPDLLADGGRAFLRFMVWASIRDGDEHEGRLRTAFDGLPEGYEALGPHREWAVGRGYLERGVRDALWDRMPAAQRNFEQAGQYPVKVDQALANNLAEQLIAYEIEHGTAEVQQALDRLTPHLRRFGGGSLLRRVVGSNTITRAFRQFQMGKYQQVPGSVLRAVVRDPALLADRGVLSIFARSLLAHKGP
jgi:glycosyltransferase involved in cell wall biosynthesis